MAPTSNQVLTFLCSDKFLWIAIGILASCAAYTTRCQLMSFKTRTVNEGEEEEEEEAPDEETACEQQGIFDLRRVMYTEGARTRVSQRYTGISVETLGALMMSPNPLVKDSARKFIHQQAANTTYLLALAHTITTTTGPARLKALKSLRCLIVPTPPPMEYSYGGVAYLDTRWKPLILESLCALDTLLAVLESLVETLMDTLHREDIVAMKESLFTISILTHYYYDASELSASAGLIEWMGLRRRQRSVQVGLRSWLAPRSPYAPRLLDRGIVECVRGCVGVNVMMLGDLRTQGSHDSSLVRIVNTLLRLPGARKEMWRAALCTRSPEWGAARMVYIEEEFYGHEYDSPIVCRRIQPPVLGGLRGYDVWDDEYCSDEELD